MKPGKDHLKIQRQKDNARGDGQHYQEVVRKKSQKAAVALDMVIKDIKLRQRIYD